MDDDLVSVDCCILRENRIYRDSRCNMNLQSRIKCDIRSRILEKEFYFDGILSLGEFLDIESISCCGSDKRRTIRDIELRPLSISRERDYVRFRLTDSCEVRKSEGIGRFY